MLLTSKLKLVGKHPITGCASEPSFPPDHPATLISYPSLSPPPLPTALLLFPLSVTAAFQVAARTEGRLHGLPSSCSRTATSAERPASVDGCHGALDAPK